MALCNDFKENRLKTEGEIEKLNAFDKFCQISLCLLLLLMLLRVRRSFRSVAIFSCWYSFAHFNSLNCRQQRVRSVYQLQFATIVKKQICLKPTFKEAKSILRKRILETDKLCSAGKLSVISLYTWRKFILTLEWHKFMKNYKETIKLKAEKKTFSPALHGTF